MQPFKSTVKSSASASSSKNAYIPPHLRKNATAEEDSWIKPKNKKTEKVEKPKIEDFPALAPAPLIQKSKMDFKELFARRKEVKKRQKKMKYGWVRLTKNGMIDSLSPEQREQSNIDRTERMMEHAMIELAFRIEKDTQRRIEFEDLEPIVIQEHSSEEEYESSEESYVDEDEEGYES
jgi:hypothetical protein